MWPEWGNMDKMDTLIETIRADRFRLFDNEKERLLRPCR
ncbi:hypothetical protein BW41_00910 [Sphingomonas sp. RIT328]|nr:hypothetical protein BW41_00910 [Sphingomonas sp. RIT328]